MEWKKESLSAAELERRQQEYLTAAMSMMKRSRPAAKESIPAPQVHTAEPEVTEPVREAAPEPEVPSAKVPAAEVTAAEVTAAEVREDVSAESSLTVEMTVQGNDEADRAPEDTSEYKEDSDKTEDDAPADEKYGVYTADELMNSEYRDDGLKKAAEILEEMTKNAEIMKKLADGDSDPDTTDFPDFSCDECEEEGDMFREEGTSEEEREQLPEQPEKDE